MHVVIGETQSELQNCQRVSIFHAHKHHALKQWRHLGTLPALLYVQETLIARLYIWRAGLGEIKFLQNHCNLCIRFWSSWCGWNKKNWGTAALDVNKNIFLGGRGDIPCASLIATKRIICIIIIPFELAVFIKSVGNIPFPMPNFTLLFLLSLIISCLLYF